MKVIRACIPDEVYSELRKHIDHHGQISSVVRNAVVAFIKERKHEGNNEDYPRRGTKKTKVNTNR